MPVAARHPAYNPCSTPFVVHERISRNASHDHCAVHAELQHGLNANAKAQRCAQRSSPAQVVAGSRVTWRSTMADHATTLQAHEMHTGSGGDEAPSAKKQRLPTHGEAGHEAVTSLRPETDEQANQHEDLTETAQTGFYMLETRVSNTDEKIEAMTQAGVQLLERLKADFLQKMQDYKEQVHSFAQSEARRWAEQSSATQQAIARLQTAKELVSTLGVQVDS